MVPSLDTAGTGQTRVTVAITAGDEGAEHLKDHRKVYSSGAEVKGRAKHLEGGDFLRQPAQRSTKSLVCEAAKPG